MSGGVGGAGTPGGGTAGGPLNKSLPTGGKYCWSPPKKFCWPPCENGGALNLGGPYSSKVGGTDDPLLKEAGGCGRGGP